MKIADYEAPAGCVGHVELEKRHVEQFRVLYEGCMSTAQEQRHSLLAGLRQILENDLTNTYQEQGADK